MSGEKITWFLNRPYGFDEHFRFRYGEGGQKTLNPCAPIADPNICLAIIDNSNLKAKRLMISGKDRKAIRVSIPATNETVELALPGKSAFIVLEPNLCDKEFVYETVRVLLNSHPDRQDHIHIASVADVITRAGWVPYWAPLQLEGKTPHVRMVAKRTIIYGDEPTLSDAQDLIQVFKKVS